MTSNSLIVPCLYEFFLTANLSLFRKPMMSWKGPWWKSNLNCFTFRSGPKKNIPSMLASNKSRSFNQVKIDRRRHSNENRLTRVPSNYMTHPMNPWKGHLKHCWLRNDKEVRQIITPSSETNSVQFPNIVNLMKTSSKKVTSCTLHYIMSLS